MQSLMKNQVKNLSSERGAILIAIIISMVVLAIVGATVYTLSSTSALNQAEAQKAAKAYYLSESCVRIAASEYKAAAPANKNTTLINLQNAAGGRTFTMPDNQGSCTVKIYPYWLYATAADVTASNTKTLYLHIPGIVQDGVTKASFPNNGKGRIRIKDSNRSEWIGAKSVAYSSVQTVEAFAQGSGTRLTFTIAKAFPEASDTLLANDEFYLGYDFSGATLAGGNLNLVMPVAEAAAAVMFPPEKGMIFLEEKDSCIRPDGKYDPIIYSYELRDTTQAGTLQLTGLQYQGTCPTVPAPFTGAAKTIYIGKNIAFRSESQYGN